ncbi:MULTISPECIES: hypothetical protein [Vibrio]|uniref:Uncharacterized protein n=1 Tax=Vibrio cyclitrophicus ZF270 TaxID=1136176 RepID=A0AAN0NDE7_9VIBR|nr:MULTISPECIES: hypothetical protein [Vibrio]TCN96325.1 hypothetical protein EDB51_115111 [Vibrio crassostreae]CAK1752051.1 hypothetical protein VCRA2110O1_140014 [Vibrio crassostreae]CAK2051057.1 hypothetical protein VCRA2110O4_30233 [Vibrio crassostreae]CAK2166526.1 hypothetical protein VCRA2114E5_80114 [Vibrio crassostreae]CAK2560986.1 hypothetical protein VCRA2110O3_140114 [Vibrio crassostreae]
MPMNDVYSELKSEKAQRQQRYAQNVAISRHGNVSAHSRGSSFGAVRRSNNALQRPLFS